MRRLSWLTRPWSERDYVAIVSDVVLPIVGVVFVLAGISEWRAQQPIKGGVVTDGRIVGQAVRESTGSGTAGETDNYPIIEFRDRRERTHRFESRVTGTGRKTGDVVEVRYDPADPSRAQWADQPGRWLWIVLVVVGSITLLVEVGLLVRRRWAASRGRPPGSGGKERRPRQGGSLIRLERWRTRKAP